MISFKIPEKLSLEDALDAEGFVKKLEIRAKHGRISIPTNLIPGPVDYGMEPHKDQVRVVDMALVSPDYKPGRVFGIYVRRIIKKNIIKNYLLELKINMKSLDYHNIITLPKRTSEAGYE